MTVLACLQVVACDHDGGAAPVTPAPARSETTPSKQLEPSPEPAAPATPAVRDSVVPAASGPGTLRTRLGSSPPCGVPACDVPGGSPRSIAEAGFRLIPANAPEAACLSIAAAERARDASNEDVAGAALFNAGRAFEGMGCAGAARAAFRASLCVRPPDRSNAAGRVVDACGRVGACGDAPCEDASTPGPGDVRGLGPTRVDGFGVGDTVPEGASLCADCAQREAHTIRLGPAEVQVVFLTPPSGMVAYVVRHDGDHRTVLGVYAEDLAGAGIPTEVRDIRVASHGASNTALVHFSTHSCNRDTADAVGDCRTVANEIGFSGTHAWMVASRCVDGDCLND